MVIAIYYQIGLVQIPNLRDLGGIMATIVCNKACWKCRAWLLIYDRTEDTLCGTSCGEIDIKYGRETDRKKATFEFNPNDTQLDNKVQDFIKGIPLGRGCNKDQLVEWLMTVIHRRFKNKPGESPQSTE